MAQPESRLSRAIKAAIKAGGGYCVKIHGGPTMEAGTPDILACIPVKVDIAVPDGIGLACEEQTIGIFVGIETKMPEGKVSLIQAHRHELIRRAYGHVLVPRSVQEAVEGLEALGWTRTPPPPRHPSGDN